MRHLSVFCILLTIIFSLIIACECVSGEDYYEVEVTLYQDGTEHTYIKTTDPDSCKEGTYWDSGDAYNKKEYISGEFTILEYNLNDIELYKQGADTSLYSNTDAHLTIWIYQDYFSTVTVDIYTLDLPRDAVHISSSPYPDSINPDTLELVWYDISGQETSFRSEEYDAIIQDDDNGGLDPTDEIIRFVGLFYILPVFIGLCLAYIGGRYNKPRWAIGVTALLPLLISWFGLLGAFSLLSKSKPEVDVFPSPPPAVAYYPPQPQQPPPPHQLNQYHRPSSPPQQPQNYHPPQQPPPPPTPQPPPPKESMVSDGVQEPVVRLHRLKEIKDLGLITDEDYDLKKKEILKDL